MKEINELIETADKLCKALEEAANNEATFCYEMQYALENYSWDVYRMKNEISNLYNRVGG